MKWEKSGLKSPMARANGLGSAKEGTDHWFHQRITAISNFFLMGWLVFSIVTMVGATYEEFTAWLSAPVNAILMILAVISTFYHAALGTQVVIEDYIHDEGFKTFKLIGVKLVLTGAAIACIFSILKIAL